MLLSTLSDHIMHGKKGRKGHQQLHCKCTEKKWKIFLVCVYCCPLNISAGVVGTKKNLWGKGWDALTECWASAARSYSHSQWALELNMDTQRCFKLLIWIFHFINHILNNSHHSKFLLQLTLFSLIVKPISQRGSAYINQHNLLAGSWWYHCGGHSTVGF